jgi:tetratricopeptide (TPR) repeat protein
MARSAHHGLFVAETMLGAGNAMKALQAVEAILGEDPENQQALALAARCRMALDQWDEAETAVTTLIAPDEPQGYLLRAAMADRNKPRGKKTLAATAEALRMVPDNAFAWHLKAVAHENLGKYQDAEAAYRQSLEFGPDDADYLSAFADFLAKTGRKQEAADLMARARELEPDNNSVLVASGTEDLRAGRKADALDKALWALRQDANDPNAIRLLVSIKTAQNPVMGIWWRWASFMERLSSGQRWAFIIGLYFAWQAFSRTILRQAPPWAQMTAIALWLGFCVLTWVGPGIFRRAIARELAKVAVKRF